MTFVIVRREISELVLSLSRIDPQDLQAKWELLSQTKISLDEKYLQKIDRGDPWQTAVAALIEINLSSSRLALQHRRSRNANKSSRETEKQKLGFPGNEIGFELTPDRAFIAAVELLEAIEYHSLTLAPLNWEWIFQSVVPWLATAIILAQLPHATRRHDINRSQKQIDIIFQRYSDTSSAVATSPMWQLLVTLKQHVPAQWDQEPTNQGHFSQSSILPTETNSRPLEMETLMFNDDIMLDFGPSTQLDPFMYNDQLAFPEVQDLPWYDPS